MALKHLTSVQDNAAQTSDEDNSDYSSLLDEVRQLYPCAEKEPPKLSTQLRNDPVEELSKIIEERVPELRTGKTEGKCNDCYKCTEQVRIKNVDSLKEGQQLALPGKKLKVRNPVSKRLHCLYMHHLIVVKVLKKSGSKATLDIIHFDTVQEIPNTTQKQDPNKRMVHKASVEYDLKYDELYEVQYKHSTRSPKDIVQRAEKTLGYTDDEDITDLPDTTATQKKSKNMPNFDSYHVLNRNCEHFATWCVAGSSESFQVKRLTDFAVSSLSNVVGRYFTKHFTGLMMNSSDEIAKCLNSAINVQEIVLGATAAVYLLYCVGATLKYYCWDYRKKGKICKSCLRDRLIVLWGRFAVFGATSILSFVIVNFAMPLIGAYTVPLGILLILLSCVMQCSVQSVYQALQSPLRFLNRETVQKVSEINIGDIVCFRYWCFQHSMIVTEVHFEADDSTVGKIKAVHYGIPGYNPCAVRTVLQEYFDINLKTSSLLRIVGGRSSYQPRSVALRAQKRIGEKKWRPLGKNTSDDMCFWAKFKLPQEESAKETEKISKSSCDLCDRKVIRKDGSSPAVGDVEIHLMEEIQVGDVLNCNEKGIVAGLISLDDGKGRVFEVDLIVYNTNVLKCDCWIVQSKRKRVNLNYDTVCVVKFHQDLCVPMKERAERARKLCNKTGDWWSTTGFIHHCVLQN